VEEKGPRRFWITRSQHRGQGQGVSAQPAVLQNIHRPVEHFHHVPNARLLWALACGVVGESGGE